VADAPPLLPRQPEQKIGERVAGRGKTGQAGPIRAVEGELAAYGLGSDGIQPDPSNFASDLEVVPAGLERKVIDELERIVLEAEWTSTFSVAGTGETGDCELRGAAQARTAGEGKSAHAQFRNDVMPRKRAFGGCIFRIAQVAEA